MPSSPPLLQALPVLPLSAVLFPGGSLDLTLKDARYVGPMLQHMKPGQGLGVICWKPAQAGEAPSLQDVGCLAQLSDADLGTAGPSGVRVRLQGHGRFTLRRQWQAETGVWLVDADLLPPDEVLAPSPEMAPAVDALERTLAALALQGKETPAWRGADAGWVANRWLELLPLPLKLKQELMALQDPVARLLLVDQFLRAKQIVGPAA